MEKIGVIGLGYVGLPVFANLSRAGLSVVGYEYDASHLGELLNGVDRTGQLASGSFEPLVPAITGNTQDLRGCTVFIIVVQSGLDESQNPSVSAITDAATIIAPFMQKDCLIILSSTVPINYTEGTLAPHLERESGLKADQDFDLVYAPERLDPGNPVHTLRTITKVISGNTKSGIDRARQIYTHIVDDNIVIAPSIKVAEASRLLENTQRDANIALLNDVSAILEAHEIDTGDVLDVAKSKWNFASYWPGLVGGHCVNVHTHFLRDAAQREGFTPVLLGVIRSINDGVAERVAIACLTRLTRRRVNPPATITILGASYKENVPDVRGSRSFEIARLLLESGCVVQVSDPLARDSDARRIHGIGLIEPADLTPADAVILVVPHDSYLEAGWQGVTKKLRDGSGVVVDIRRILPRGETPKGVDLWRL